MDTLNIPGLSIAVINDSKVVYHQTFGYANLEKQLPVTDKTIFEGASLSKSVFAFFVMKFVEEGKLDLDKPLYEYLPYPEIAHDDRYKQITGRMVLSHRSGYPNWRENEEDDKLKIKLEPGTNYEYSGEGYQYLAMVLKHNE
jgi:CubicO group peptidase (beta-lactamase class C family)